MRFVNNIQDEGITTIYSDPKNITNKKSEIETIYPSKNAKYVILENEKILKIRGKKIVRRFKILSNKDIDDVELQDIGARIYKNLYHGDANTVVKFKNYLYNNDENIKNYVQRKIEEKKIEQMT